MSMWAKTKLKNTTCSNNLNCLFKLDLALVINLTNEHNTHTVLYVYTGPMAFPIMNFSSFHRDLQFGQGYVDGLSVYPEAAL